MTNWFKLSPVNSDDFFESAPILIRYEMHLDSHADEVWAELTADTPLAWCRMLKGRYTSGRPFSVGTTREEDVAGGLLKLRERFFVWDDANRRHAFYVEEANVPVYEQFAEDYQVTPAVTGCIFVWRIAMKGRQGTNAAMKLSAPVMRKTVTDSYYRDTLARFGGVLKST